MSKYSKQEDTPRNYELWVQTSINDRFLANKLTGVYNTERNKAVTELEKVLKRNLGKGYQIKVKEL